MNFHQMECVLAVARYKSFSIAAESCYLSQSSLSQQISNLEKELGTRLFNRSTRNIQITEAGKAFVELATGILHDCNLLQQKMFSYSNMLCGTINIGAITSLEKLHFSDLIAEFYSDYPNLTVNVLRGDSIYLLESLEKSNIDVAFLTRPTIQGYPNLDFQTVGCDEYVLVVPEKHPLSHKKVVDLAQFKNDRFILHQPSQSISGICLQACKEAGFEPNIACQVGASSISLNLIRRGLGVGLFASEEFGYYRINGIRALKLKNPIKKEIVMVLSRKYEPSPLTDAFVEFVLAHTQGAESSPIKKCGKE